ncbi:uncharacterized protein LOC128682092 [Plodia interpunctella]|uniref:uncharacterized protein LOC128682092 n=1 Tax=Plodia interpunctella TaxID=58824 RepID=UPI00236814DB|nr:uncharacterized protein LOC128682092 [Plodia interpunctella]
MMEPLIFIFCAFACQVMQVVSAYPSKGHPYKSEHCIKMTPAKEQEINVIVTRLTDFLNNITSEFEDYDIRLIKLDIESHSEDEVEEKNVELQLTVNDCAEEEEWNGAETHYESKEIDVTAEIPVVREVTTERHENVHNADVTEKCCCACKNSKDNIAGKEINVNADNVDGNNFAPLEILWFFDVSEDRNDDTFNKIQLFDGNKFTDSKNQIEYSKNDVIYQRNDVLDQKNYAIDQKNDGTIQKIEVITADNSNNEIQSKKPELIRFN